MSGPDTPDRELLRAVLAYTQHLYGTQLRPQLVRIKLENGEELRLPVPAILPTTNPVPTPSPSPPLPAPLPANRHSPDYRSIIWHGESYTFTAGQSAVIGILWEAWDNHTPEVSADYLLTESGSDARRLQDLFSGHPAWGTVLVPGTSRGSYRLWEETVG